MIGRWFGLGYVIGGQKRDPVFRVQHKLQQFTAALPEGHDLDQVTGQSRSTEGIHGRVALVVWQVTKLGGGGFSASNMSGHWLAASSFSVLRFKLACLLNVGHIKHAHILGYKIPCTFMWTLDQYSDLQFSIFLRLHWIMYKYVARYCMLL